VKWVYDNPTYKDRDDCSIRSFAKLLDKPYIDVKRELLELKWLNRIPRYYYWENINKYIERYKLKQVKLKEYTNIEEFLTDNPVGHYLFSVKGHLATGIDGVLYDSWDSRHQRIYKVWQRV
jgi:hypothetical protein